MIDEQESNSESLVAPGQRAPASRAQGLVARGLRDLLARQTRTVHFPSDRSVGQFWLMSENEGRSQFSWKECIRRLRIARGDVRIPAAMKMHLSVGFLATWPGMNMHPGPVDPSFLRALAPDDICWLCICADGITDAGLIHLGGLTGLEGLDLGTNSAITDAGLIHLRGLAKLDSINVCSTKVTDSGINDLKRFLPKKVEIMHVYSPPPPPVDWMGNPIVVKTTQNKNHHVARG